jgi:hypothetical protein
VDPKDEDCFDYVAYEVNDNETDDDKYDGNNEDDEDD